MASERALPQRRDGQIYSLPAEDRKASVCTADNSYIVESARYEGDAQLQSRRESKDQKKKTQIAFIVEKSEKK